MEPRRRPFGGGLFRKIKHLIEYAFVRLVDACSLALPRRWALTAGEWTGRAAEWILRSRRQLLLRNVRASFPEMAADQRRRLNREVWKNLGRTAFEFSRLTDIRTDNYRDFFDYDGVDAVDRASKGGRGLIFVTFHFTNWEMAGIGHQFRFKNLVAIAKPMKNPWVERWVQKKRRACGMDIILHRNAVRASLKVLRSGKSIAILMDQNIRQGGVFVDFLGRPAATTTLPALLHVRTGAPVFLAHTVRNGEKFRIVYSPINFPSLADSDGKVEAYTQTLSDAIGDVIRVDPQHWFWVHNRWKRSPNAA